MFTTFNQYNQLIVFFIGVLHFFSYYAIGVSCLNVIRVSANNVYLRCFSFSFGVLIISLTVQYLSFFQINCFKTIFTILEYILLLIGCITLYSLRAELKKILDELKSNKYLFISLLIIVGGLLISIAPLSKHDELHYHALTPVRLLSDGYMHFYMWPFEGAILPQMFFQISVTPLFAIHVPNAANVSGYMFSVLIFILLYSYTKSMTDKKYAFIAASICLIGMHTYVFHTTLGEHAYGEMSLLLLLLILLFSKAFINIGRGYKIFIFSTLCVAVLSSKLSHLPIIIIITGYIYYTEIFKAENKISDYFCLFLPYILFYLPILVYTFHASGSPFGPVFANIFNDSVYNVTEIAQVLNRYSSKLPYLNLTITYFFKIICFDYSPLVIVSLLVFIIRGYRYSLILFLIFIIQLMVILSPDDSINNCETGHFTLGKKCYTNTNANLVIFRTPFKKPLVKTVSVHELITY